MTDIISPDEFEHLIHTLTHKIGHHQYDTILGLSTGGFPVAAHLAKQLHITTVAGLTVRKQDGHYHLDQSIVQLQDCTHRRVLVVDDASRRGLLAAHTVQAVRNKGGHAKSAVLIATIGGIDPDYVAEYRTGTPPRFWWEP